MMELTRKSSKKIHVDKIEVPRRSCTRTVQYRVQVASRSESEVIFYTCTQVGIKK